jgi:hypothetical protein
MALKLCKALSLKPEDLGLLRRSNGTYFLSYQGHRMIAEVGKAVGITA